MDPRFKAIPSLAALGDNNQQDAWKVLASYLNYLSIIEELGRDLWLVGTDYERKRIIAKFETQRHEPWAQSFVLLIQRIAGVLSSYQDEHEINALPPTSRLQQSDAPPTLDQSVSQQSHPPSPEFGTSARVSGIRSNNGGGTKSKRAGLGSWVVKEKAAPEPFSGGDFRVNRRPWLKTGSETERRGAFPSTQGQRSLQGISWGSGKLPSTGDNAISHEAEEIAPNEAASSPEPSLDADTNTATDDDSGSTLPETYIYPPGTVATHPSEYTRDQDFKVGKYTMSQTQIKINITPSLQTSLDAINALPLTFEEQEQAMRGSPNRNAWSLLRNIEFCRALTFSPNFQSMVKDHQVSLLNGWGLRVDHEATCLTLPGEWISSSPEALHQMWLKNTADRAMFRVDAVRLRDHGIEHKVSADSTKARIFATIADATAGKVLDTDKTKHASHKCGKSYCLIPRHINMEDPNPNYQRDGCRLRALELRRKGLPVPWKCGVHGPGEDDCLMQLMVLTDVERMNLQFSMQLGRPITNPIQDPKHGFPTEVRSFEDFDGGFNFGGKDSSLDGLMSRFDGEREKMADPKACCPLCGRTWIVASVVVLNHIIKEHTSHEGFVAAILQVAKKSILDFEMR
ncbi:hypothetical protein BKA61DRAFT_663603 [Leptodontidium sp. MPI-SDFR-AT-0119]|nr:hypothetical protein BKA61DRAFT_663603 [Leptodontidium sp. MPI-SDFR-AT-0119]